MFKRYLNWTIASVVLWALMYFAFIGQVAGALHVLKFYAFFLLVVSPLLLMKTTIKAMASNPEMSWIFFRLSQLQQFVMLGAFVWTGHSFTAAAWLIFMICAGLMQVQVNAMREALVKKAQQ